MTSSAAAARALFERLQHAVLCSAHASLAGWPFGSIVPYAPSASGDAVVFLSDIAEHTQNLLRDPRASLFVADPAAAAAPQAGARLSLLVRARRPAGAELADGEARYFARFPRAAAMRSAHGFDVWTLEVDQVRWIAGFGEMGWIDRAAWTSQPDPLAPHAAGIAAHLNRDHSAAVAALVGHATGVTATAAVVTGLDRGGLSVSAHDPGGVEHRVRVPFPTACDSVEEVRRVVIAMLGGPRRG